MEEEKVRNFLDISKKFQRTFEIKAAMYESDIKKLD
jgi:hypothetical protein